MLEMIRFLSYSLIWYINYGNIFSVTKCVWYKIVWERKLYYEILEIFST